MTPGMKLPPGATLEQDPGTMALPPGATLEPTAEGAIGISPDPEAVARFERSPGIPLYQMGAVGPAQKELPPLSWQEALFTNPPKQVGSGLMSAAAGATHLTGNIAGLLDAAASKIAELTGTEKGGAFKHIEDWARQQQASQEKTAAELAGGRQDLASQFYRTGASAAASLPAYAVATELGGPIGGLAELGALETADQGWQNQLKAAAENAATGGALTVMGPASRPIRLMGSALMTYAQLRLQGVDHETALANAMTMGGLSATHPGEVGYQEWKHLPGVPSVPGIPERFRVENQLNPQEQASQAYLRELGIRTPLSMQTGSQTAQQLEASVGKSPGGGAFGRQLEASKGQLVKAGQERELPRIYPEPVTEEQAGAAVGGKLASDLERTRRELTQQVSPEATTPELAGQKVINRGKQAIQALDQESKQAYKAASLAERDPRNFQDVVTGHDENGEPVIETMPLPIDMKDVQDALKPIAARYEYTLSDTDARASIGLKTMRQIIKGPRYKPASAAELDLSMLKEAARTEKGLAELRDPSQGMAAFSVGKLQSAIDQTMAGAAYPGYDPASGGESPALGHLQAGRAATAKKHGIADIFAGFGRQDINKLEPVGVFRRLTWGGDAGLNQLREIAKIAPDQMPAVGRAFIEGGGNWSELGPETKNILFRGDRDLIKNLDQYHADLARFGPLTKLEPVALFDRLTRPEARTINQLRAVAKQTPDEMPKLGRAFVQGLLERSTREGDLEKAKSTLQKWLNLDAESKAIMFEDPKLVRDLDSFFFSLKRMMANPNPSGSGFMMGMNQLRSKITQGLALVGGFGGGAAHGGVGAGVGAGLGLLGGAGLEIASNAWLAKKLFDPKFIRMVTKGIDMQNRGNLAGSRLVAGQILKDFPPGEEPPEGPSTGGGEPPPSTPPSTGGGIGSLPGTPADSR